MAKNRQPVLKRCKTLGLSPAVLGYSKETRRNPKQMRRKQSEYGLQLNEKQKVTSQANDIYRSPAGMDVCYFLLFCQDGTGIGTDESFRGKDGRKTAGPWFRYME